MLGLSHGKVTRTVLMLGMASKGSESKAPMISGGWRDEMR